MLRRVLPVAAVAAAITLAPSAAWATPDSAPVENTFAAGYSASVDVILSDGRHASATINEYRGAVRDGWRGGLSLQVWNEQPCDWDYCPTQSAFGSVDLTDAQVSFDRNLRTASVHDVAVEVVDPTYGAEPDPWIGDPGEGDSGDGSAAGAVDGSDGSGDAPVTDPGTGDMSGGGDPAVGDPAVGDPAVGDPAVGDPAAGDPSEGDAGPGDEGAGDGTGGLPDDQPVVVPWAPQTFVVSLEFKATGGSNLTYRDATHQTTCGDGSRECQSNRLYVQRQAPATLTLDGASYTSKTGMMSYSQGVDAAAPKFQDGGY